MDWAKGFSTYYTYNKHFHYLWYSPRLPIQNSTAGMCINNEDLPIFSI